MLRLHRTPLIVWLIPGLLQEPRADVSAERLAEIPAALDAAARAKLADMEKCVSRK